MKSNMFAAIIKKLPLHNDMCIWLVCKDVSQRECLRIICTFSRHQKELLSSLNGGNSVLESSKMTVVSIMLRVRTIHYYQLLHPLIPTECIWNVFTNETHKTATSRWRTCEAVVCLESLNKTGSSLLEVNPVWLVGMEMCSTLHLISLKISIMEKLEAT